MSRILFPVVLGTLVAGLVWLSERHDRSSSPAFRQKLDDWLFVAFLVLAALLLGYYPIRHLTLSLKGVLGI
jgi:lipopolysaccharide export LptBFGC system permease protein LptF